MRRLGTSLLALVSAAGLGLAAVSPAAAVDRPFSTSRLTVRPEIGPGGGATTGGTGQFSKVQIEGYRCAVAAGAEYGTPDGAMDISCNDAQPYRQDFNPDNELAIAVDPEDPLHLLAGSNDYFYRFNRSTGARQALVPTGFFTSFDGGATWVDGQVPVRSGNGAGDPAPAFDGRHDVALMAQLENVGGLGGGVVTQGDVSVSRSTDGGLTWSEPVTVMQGQGAGIGPANQAKFYDKEWLTVDNSPTSPHYGRAYLTSTLFLNGLHGAYTTSDIWISWSDDGGATWVRPRAIPMPLAACTFQTTGPAGQCDEDQASIPEVAPDGTLHVHVMNGNIETAWESPGELENTVLDVVSHDGGVSWDPPSVVAHLEDGLTDTPYSVIGRQTVTGHQIRWNAWGNIAADPSDAAHVVVVYADNAAGVHDALPADADGNGFADCLEAAPGEAPDYDPCAAVTQTDVYLAESWDGGRSWNPRLVLDATAGDQWFPWADFAPDGTLWVGYDSNENIADPGGDRDDTFNHVLASVAPRTAASGPVALATREALVPDGAGRSPAEQVDISVTHWAGQYVPEDAWPAVCGPDGYSDPPVTDAAGKDCNVFHGDYTGLAVGSDGRANVVWTGLNRFVTSPQVDPYTGEPHDGYAQDAMFARR